MQRRSKIVLAVFSSLVLAGYLATTFALAQAQPDAQSAPEARAAAAASGAEAPLTVQYESHLTIRDDLSATELTTKRLTVNAPVAIQAVGQQRLPYIEGMHVLEVVEAFTEKPDGRRIAVAPSNIITQDAAPPQQATYFRDMKQRTVIFPDVSVGDTLVLTSKTEQVQGVFPGQFIYAEMFPRNLSFTSADVTVEAPAALETGVVRTAKPATTLDIAPIPRTGRKQVALFKSCVAQPAEDAENGGSNGLRSGRCRFAAYSCRRLHYPMRSPPNTR